MRLVKLLGIELIEVSFQEKLISAIGSTIAIFFLFWVTRTILPIKDSISVVASMGATAVLLFAVPHGQLSQPWPLLGGHTVSAIIGVACAQTFSDPAIATAVAVGASIGVMHQLKCIHPPGGASAFTAVMGGKAIHNLGYQYVLFPVLLNASVMLLLAIVINAAFHWRRYPAGLMTTTQTAKTNNASSLADMHHHIVSALRSLDSFIDISEDDLQRLSTDIASRIAARRSAARPTDSANGAEHADEALPSNAKRPDRPL